MSSDVEPAKKILLPYLQRADELQKHEPLVAYYCRLYAMERGLKIPAKERTKVTNSILISLMSQLEKDKRSIQLSPEDNLYVEGFALSLFAKADKQDRAGRADLSTAKTFYAASIFIEILHQFGSLQPDIEQKQKYAVWKAADIRKAVSEGRKPIPGPPGGDEESLMSPGRPVDSVEEKNPVHRMASISSGDLNPMVDDGLSTISSQGVRLDEQGHYIDTKPQQPHHDFAYAGHAQSGYAGGYPGVYHPSSMPDTEVASSSASRSPHGSTGYQNNHPQAGLYPGYTQGMAGGHMYPSAHATAYARSDEGSDAAYYQSQPQGYYPNASGYSATAPVFTNYSSFSGTHDSTGLVRTNSDPLSKTKQINYHPSPEKIAEAQKVAKFAVSALAFDDVPTAVSYLKQSLELLTNPSSS